MGDPCWPCLKQIALTSALHFTCCNFLLVGNFAIAGDAAAESIFDAGTESIRVYDIPNPQGRGVQPDATIFCYEQPAVSSFFLQVQIQSIRAKRSPSCTLSTSRKALFPGMLKVWRPVFFLPSVPDFLYSACLFSLVLSHLSCNKIFLSKHGFSHGKLLVYTLRRVGSIVSIHKKAIDPAARVSR